MHRTSVRSSCHPRSKALSIQMRSQLADPVGVNEVGILEIEAARLGGRKKRFDLPPPPVMGQGALWIRVGSDHKQVSADQPHPHENSDPVSDESEILRSCQPL